MIVTMIRFTFILIYDHNNILFAIYSKNISTNIVFTIFIYIYLNKYHSSWYNVYKNICILINICYRQYIDGTTLDVDG